MNLHPLPKSTSSASNSISSCQLMLIKQHEQCNADDLFRLQDVAWELYIYLLRHGSLRFDTRSRLGECKSIHYTVPHIPANIHSTLRSLMNTPSLRTKYRINYIGNTTQLRDSTKLAMREFPVNLDKPRLTKYQLNWLLNNEIISLKD